MDGTQESVEGPPTPRAQGGARRRMTVMFCDLVGSTPLAERNDPEVVLDITRAYQEVCGAIVARYDGHIAQYIGDGIVVYFGHPRVHDDDARRAVLAGLEMVEAVTELSNRIQAEHSESLSVRIAVHTGLLVIADLGTATNRLIDGAVGSTVNEAARLEGVADADTVVISSETLELVEGLFEVVKLEDLDLRGVARQLVAYRVLGPTALDRTETGVTPGIELVGRKDEYAALVALWSAAHEPRANGTKAIALTGEAGMGKSRLVHELAELAGSGLLKARCQSEHQGTPLQPFRRLLRQVVGLADDAVDSLAALADHLRAFSSLTADHLLRFLGPLMVAGTELAPVDDELAAMDAAIRHDHTITAVIDWLAALARQSPRMVVVEDVTWADESTLRVIDHLATLTPPNLALIVTARDPESVMIVGEPGVDHLALGPLNEDEQREAAAALASVYDLPDLAVEELLARGDGVPYYLEELARNHHLIGNGHQAQALAGSEVPPVLHAPLMARLETAGAETELAQVAATIGREVDLDVLSEVMQEPKSALEPRLATLADHLILETVVDGGVDRYRFRHALLRDVAYDLQLRSRSREVHALAAEAIVTVAKRDGEQRWAQAATHHERADQSEQAIQAYRRAGSAAERDGAHADAIAQLTRGLHVVEALPPSEDRDVAEIKLRQKRSYNTVALNGYNAEGAAEDYHRCLVLCERLGSRPEYLDLIAGLWSLSIAQGDLDSASEAASLLARATPASGSSAGAVLTADGAQAVIEMWRGNFERAREHMAATVGHLAPEHEKLPIAGWPLPQDPIAAVLAEYCIVLWVTGHRAEAQQTVQRSFDRIACLPFPQDAFSEAYARSHMAVMYLLEGDLATTRDMAEHLLEAGRTLGFAFWRRAGEIFDAIATARAGEPGGLDALERGAFFWQRNGSRVMMPFLLVSLAELQYGTGRSQDAKATLEQALVISGETGGDFHTAEALRLQARLRLTSDAERGLRDAMELARGQGATLFELRAALDLYDVASTTASRSSSVEAIERALDSIAEPDGYPDVGRARAVLRAHRRGQTNGSSDAAGDVGGAPQVVQLGESRVVTADPGTTVRVIEHPPSAQVDVAGDCDAHRLVLVLAGSVAIHDEEYGPGTHIDLPVGVTIGPLMTGPEGARLYETTIRRTT